ncbi:MAG TPA: DUF3014 domain-containing protein [Steroidobacteraceae bacterium]|nr:DUF3014 domain-containing protein [Steroidobacteraceae bacterium]
MENENLKYVAAAVAVVGLSIGAIIYISVREPSAPPPKPAAVVPPPAAAPEEPAVKHPLPAPETQVPLPPLNESDEPMKNVLTDLIGKDSVEQFIVTKDLVRHIVVSVDNLSTEKVAERIRPVKPMPGKFAVGGSEDAPVLSPANYERYNLLVQSIRATDTKTLVETYTRHYPLFQEAYESLGHPPEYFNDRLIEVIDHLLATPEVRDPIALARPGVQYEFADPKLESLSAGQKVLIRMGGENAKAVKDKLRELRGEIVASRP